MADNAPLTLDEFESVMSSLADGLATNRKHFASLGATMLAFDWCLGQLAKRTSELKDLSVGISRGLRNRQAMRPPSPRKT